MENKLSSNAFTEIEKVAEKEMKRMEEVFRDLKILDRDKASDFYDFAKNYFLDGKHFLKTNKPVQAFEAFIISWAYIDIGIKLNMFETKLKQYFTSGD